jgi:hypothetical protein
MIRKYVLLIWSEHNYIFSHRVVHWVFKYTFQPCILAIVRLYCKLNKQLYNMCVGYSGGGAWFWTAMDRCQSYIKNVCLFVWNLHKSTFLNRSEPYFAHIFPLVCRRS